MSEQVQHADDGEMMDVDGSPTQEAFEAVDADLSSVLGIGGADDEPANDESEPSAESEQEEPAEAKEEEPKPKDDENKPSKERYEESLDSLWAEARRRTRDAKRQLQELEQQRAQIEQQRASLAEQQKLQELMRSNPREAYNAFVRQAGLDPNEFYQELVEANLSEGGETPKAIQRQLQQLREEQQKHMQRLEEQRRMEQQQQHNRFLRSRVDELASVQQHDALKKQFPYLASIPEHKFREEVTNSVLWAAQNKPDLLNDPIEFAKVLDDAAREEYSMWQERYSALTQANSEPAKSEATRDGSETEKPAKTTITNNDTVNNGVGRQLSEQERFHKAGDMLLGLIPSLD